MPINTAPQVEELKMSHCASKLPCVLPEPQQASCHHLWTTEDTRENQHTQWDAAEWHPPEIRIGGKTNDMRPDEKIQSASTVNVLADYLSVVWTDGKNISLLSLNKCQQMSMNAYFLDCSSSPISPCVYLFSYRNITAELKGELNILH